MKTKKPGKSPRKSKKRNLASEEAAKMRVQIAKDVLKQLAPGAKKLTIEQGTYCEINKIDDIPEDIENNVDLQQIFERPKVKCRVCAKGALFIAAVLRYDELKINQFLPEWEQHALVAGSKYDPFDNGSEITKFLGDYFPLKQLDLIETIFEGDHEWLDDHSRPVQAFVAEYPNVKNRLKAMMENIIKNKGEFVI